MVEALLRDHMRERGASAAVSSAGLLEDGHSAAPEVVSLLSERGIDLSPHRSRRLTRDLIEDSDLVLAMARDHLREAVLLAPAAFGRIFTLKELVRRGEAVGPAGAGLGSWLGVVAGGRQRRDLMGQSPEDDVDDPIGGPLSAFRKTLEELDDLCRRLAHLLAP